MLDKHILYNPKLLPLAPSPEINWLLNKSLGSLGNCFCIIGGGEQYDGGTDGERE